MRKSIIVVYSVLMDLYFCINIVLLAHLSIGYKFGEIIYSGLYINYIFFLIPVLFVLSVCICVMKKIYIKGSIVLGFLTGLLMIIYSYNYSILITLYCICMGVLSFAVTIHLMFNLRPASDDEMRLIAGIMSGCPYKKKFKKALMLLGLCIICVAYIIIPKKWVCLFVESNDYMNHAYEMSDDVLEVSEKIEIYDGINYMSNKSGWKFYANRSGNTKVSILSEIVYDENDDWIKETWDIYVDDSLNVHHNVDFDYYLNVYEFFFFVIVNSLGLCIVFLISGFIDMWKARRVSK